MGVPEKPEMSLEAGSLILVSGATGFVASHVIDQLLERGFRVRGSVRDFHSASWLLSSHLEEASSGQLELVEVPDIETEGAFDEAIKGVSGVLHIATTTATADGGGFDTNPDVVIPGAVQGMSSMFRSALKEPTVKEFVFTGSIVAATLPIKGLDTKVGPDTWNDAATKQAYAPPPHGPIQGMFVYMAGKVAAEKAFLKLMEEHKPHFSGNIVSPSGIIGQPRHVKHSDVHHNWVTSLWRDEQERLDAFPTAFFVDVKDIALVHIAAMLDPDVKNQRFQAWGINQNWNLFLKELRTLRPQKKWLPDFSDPGFLTISTDQSIALGLLQKWGKRDWTPLKETLADNLNNPYFKVGVEKS